MESVYASSIESPVGLVHILATDAFVYEISFSGQKLEGYTESDLSKLAAQQLLAYFKGELTDFQFPMQQKGTAFQQEVWQNLLQIPYAETRSYAQFSAHNPLAIRAIAAANGKNNLAIVVPCHRVIGSNGKLVGYAGGLWRKKWLLQHEREISYQGQTELKF